MMPVMGSQKKVGIVKTGGNNVMSGGKADKMPFPGSSGWIGMGASAGKSNKEAGNYMPTQGEGGKSDKVTPQQQLPPLSNWSPSTGAVKGNAMTKPKGLNPSGKKLPMNMYPKPIMPDASSYMNKFGKSTAMDASSYESKTSKSSGIPMIPMGKDNEMVPMPGANWNPESKTSKLPFQDYQNKYVMPQKRPPPPELDSQYYTGWNPGEMYGKAGKTKSSKGKSAKSKGGKGWHQGGYTSTPTYYPSYMPTEGDDVYQGWMGGGGWNSNGQQSNNGGKPGYGKPGSKPGSNGGSGKPGYGQNGQQNDSGKPGYGQNGSGKPGYGQNGQQNGSGKPGYGQNGQQNGSGKPGYGKPGNGWWGGQQPMPEKPVNEPDSGGNTSTNLGKPGYWWGGGQQPQPERPVYNKPEWGGISSNWGSWGSWEKPGWGNSWWGSGSGSSWNSWNEPWWGGWGGSKVPIPSMPTAKPVMLTPGPVTMAPTPKPSELFPSDTPQPSKVMPTYAPSNPIPTYAPSPSSLTYSPTSSTTTLVPTYSPTSMLTEYPSESPSSSPSKFPTVAPSATPSFSTTTYEPSTHTPTFVPTPIATTYEPTTATYPPTPSTMTYDPTGFTNPPTGITDTPTADGIPTFSPTSVPTEEGGKTPSPDSDGIPTFTPTSSPTEEGTGGDELPTFSPSATPTEQGSKTPRPTSEPLHLCVWGSASSSGQEDMGDLLVPIPFEVTGVDASAGSRYSLVLEASGTISAAGFIEDFDNYHGHLGINPDDLLEGTNDFQEISQVFDESKGEETDPPIFTRVYAGVENSPGSGVIHSIFLDSDGHAWATGSNTKGQLCLGDESDRLMPVMISLEGIRIVDVAIGGEHTLLLDKDGNVFGCGSNEMGQLGLLESTVKTNTPLKLYELPLASTVSAGRDHSLFIAEDSVYVTGDNTFGQLCVDTKGKPISEPRALDIPVDIISTFEAIFTSSYILFTDGSVIGCGNNNVGQLGNGEDKELVTFEPTVVETAGFVVEILGTGPSARSVFFITDEDSVFGTGLNSNGQLGVGDLDNRNVPTQVLFEIDDLMMLSAGEDHTVALCKMIEMESPTLSPTEGNATTLIPTSISDMPTASPTYLGIGTDTPTASPTYLGIGTDTPTSSPTYMGTVTPTYAPTTYAVEGSNLFFWGNPQSIGQDEEENVTQPLTIDGKVIFASAGSRYSILVMNEGSALSSGVIESFEEYKGHLGVDPDLLAEGTNSFQLIVNVSNTNETLTAPRFEMVFAGVENSPDSGNIHTLLLDSRGNAFSTGSNSQGQLCLGDDEDRFIPEEIPIEGPIIGAAVGGEHTLLLHKNGTVFVCGSNSVGQIGLGEDVKRTSSPLALDDLSLVSSISAGVEHSLFVAEDGIYVTGDNSYGQLCSNSTDFLTNPMMINLPISDIVSFEAIKFSSYVLYIDGSINACGKNDYGQLGDGTNQDKILTEVVLNKEVRSLYTGSSSESVFFVTDDELIYGTGLNEWGNLGVGDQDNRNIPTRVKFEEQVMNSAITPSEDFTIAFGVLAGSLPPSLSPTATPTTPITLSPTRDSLNFFFWGAPESLGQAGADVMKPLYVEENAVQASAGSKYTLIVLQDGVILAGGFVDKDNYQGHLGLGGIVVSGENDFKEISNVYDADGAIQAAPAFDLAFAGVEYSPDSGIIHTILLDRKGNVYSTGSNSQGQLCLGDDEDRLIPEEIPIEGPIIGAAVGGEHTLLLHENGTVYVCGSNTVGQIGLGEDVKRTSSPLTLDDLSSVSSISAGIEHSLFVAEDGIYVTGDNSYGQLCSNEDEAVFEPAMLDTSINKVSAFEAIRSSSFILHLDGLVTACGKNDYGQLGDGTNQTSASTTVELDQIVRLLGTGPSSESVFFVAEDENVYGTGLNSRGNLGVGDQDNRNIPTKVRFPNEVMLSSLSAAEDHTVSLGIITGTNTPTAMPTFGPTTSTPSTTPTFSPTEFTEVPSSTPSMDPSTMPSNVPTATATVTPTFSPSMMEVTKTPTFSPSEGGTNEPSTSLEENTPLFAWGAQESVGLPTGQDTTPEPLDQSVIDLSGGSLYSLILLPDGTAQSAGYIESIADYHGHLGLKGGDVEEGSNEFQEISTSYDNDQIISSPPFTRVFAGVSQLDSPGSIHSFLIDDEGQAWATGSNTYGELCLGDNDDRLIPTKVTLDGNVISVAVGVKHTLLLIDDGTVYACGSNEDGQLALGEATDQFKNSPTKVDGLEGVVGISAGKASSLFLANDGMYVSGSNVFGQLCVDSNMGNLVEPTLLEGVNAGDVASFEAISTSAYILFKDGSVGACGRNNFGQLADGSNEDKIRVVVKPIPDDIPIRRLGVGPSAESVFFVNDSGSIYASGLNDRGQLGIGDTENRNTLTLVDFSGDFSSNQQLSASGDHTLAR